MGWKDTVKGLAEKGQEAVEQARGAQQERLAEKEADWSARGILFEGKSHEEGRNATVTLYQDRIERIKERGMASLSKARQDTEVTPMRSVSSVQAKKDGLMYTKVSVFASGNTIDFRFGHDEAQRFKDALQKLLLDPAVTGGSATPSAPDNLDQLKKLAELKDAGVISEEEFQAKKTQLLGL
jgi:hypothetical protein